MAGDPTGAIDVRHLTRRFGDFTAVDDLSFRVHAGEVFGFLGSNGAGKSTTIRMLCGLLRPSSGSAQVGGVDVGADPDGVKRRIGYMSQRFSLYEQLTVDQNITFFGGVYGLRGQRLASRRAFALEMAGLKGREDALTATLSGGWRQRLALGCAVLHEPPIVFLDEPTGGVDPLSRRRFWRLIHQLSRCSTNRRSSSSTSPRAASIRCRGDDSGGSSTNCPERASPCSSPRTTSMRPSTAIEVGIIDRGRLAALGSVSELKKRFDGRAIVEVRSAQPVEAMRVLDGIAEVEKTSLFGTAVHAVLQRVDDGPSAVEGWLRAAGLETADCVVAEPTLEDVFIDVAEGGEAA